MSERESITPKQQPLGIQDIFKDIDKTDIQAEANRRQIGTYIAETAKDILDVLNNKESQREQATRAAIRNPLLREFGSMGGLDAPLQAEVVSESDEDPGVLAIATFANGSTNKLWLRLRPIVNGEPVETGLKDSIYELFPYSETFEDRTTVSEKSRAGQMVFGDMLEWPEGQGLATYELHKLSDLSVEDPTLLHVAQALAAIEAQLKPSKSIDEHKAA